MAWQVITLLLVCSAMADDKGGDQFAVSSAVNRGSINLLKEAIAEAKGDNVVTSPLGAFFLVSLYSAGASGQLRDDITKVLGVNNYTTLFNSYSQLSRDFAAMDTSYLTLANKVYIAKGSKFAPSFVEASKGYNTDLDELDFHNPKAAVDDINKWAEEKTRGHIKDPVTEDMITPDVAVALFNVIFFKGHWVKPFLDENTKQRDFHTKNGDVKKPIMSLETRMNYLENPEIGARTVAIPYEEKGFRMVIVLPNDKDGLPTMMEKLSANPDLFTKELRRFRGNDYSQVDLKLPKFDIKTKLDLEGIFKKIGLSRLFSDSANEIVENSSVAVSKAFQEAFIEVDEKGSTAGAFTGGIAVFTSAFIPPGEPVKFHATHPFMFSILHEDTVLFIGTYNQ